MSVLKFIIKFIWELPSNFVAILFMFFLGVDDFTFNKEKSVFIVKMSYRGGLTLGCFVFIHEQDMEALPHEYGHVKQGWICGPLYLLIIGVKKRANILLKISFKSNSL